MDRQDFVNLIRTRQWKAVLFYYALIAYTFASLIYFAGLPAWITQIGGLCVFLAGIALWPSDMGKRLANPEHLNVFRSRIVELEDGVLRTYIDSGSRSDVLLSDFVHVERRLGFYLLYLSPDHFMFVAESSFREPADRENFRAAILAAIPKQTGF